MAEQERAGGFGDGHDGIRPVPEESPGQARRGAERFEEVGVKDQSGDGGGGRPAEPGPGDGQDRDHEIAPGVDVDDVYLVAGDEKGETPGGAEVSAVADDQGEGSRRSGGRGSRRTRRGGRHR